MGNTLNLPPSLTSYEAIQSLNNRGVRSSLMVRVGHVGQPNGREK